MIKRLLFLIFILILTYTSIFAAPPYNITVNNPWSYGSGSFSAATYATNGAQLTYTYNSGGNAGMGFNLTPWPFVGLDCTTVKTLRLSIQGTCSAIGVSLLSTKNNTEKTSNIDYYVGYISNNAFQTIDIDFSQLSQGLDVDGVWKMQIKPWDSGTNLTVQIKDIQFITSLPSGLSLFTPLKTTLTAGGYLTNTYPILNSSYSSYLPYLWAGYKYNLRDQYIIRNIASTSLQGLFFDPSTGSNPTDQDSNDQTTSEAAGYGMLLALYMNDQTAFDTVLNQIDAYMQKTSSTQLFVWHVSANGTINDTHSATDADCDIAAALVMADLLTKRGGWSSTHAYGTMAQTLIDSIYKKDTEWERYLRPGDYVYGGRSLINPSYFSPGWYRLFALYESVPHNWQSLIDQGYTTLMSINGGSAYSKGLAPDWCDSNGSSVAGQSFDLSSEAIRVYWRMYTDWQWWGETKAYNFLSNAASNFAGLQGTSSPGNATYMHISDGSQAASYTNSAIKSMYAIPALTNLGGPYASSWQAAITAQLQNANSGQYSFMSNAYYFVEKYNYYSQSLGLFGMLIFSGNFPNLAPLMNTTQAPALVQSTQPAIAHNFAENQVGLILQCSQGAAFITTVDLQVNLNGNQTLIQYNNQSNQVSLSSQTDIVHAGISKEYNGNNLSISINYILSSNAADSSVITYKYLASDHNNYNTGLTSLVGQSTFRNFPPLDVVLAGAEFDFVTANTTGSYQVLAIQHSLTLSIDLLGSKQWFLNTWSEDPATGYMQTGLVQYSSSGSVVGIIPLKILVTTNTYSINSWTDPLLSTVNVRSNTFPAINQNSTSMLQPYNIYLVAGLSAARPGNYKNKISLELISSPSLLIDNFDDGDLRSKSGAYWNAGASEYFHSGYNSSTANYFIDTSSVSCTPVLKCSYTHGTSPSMDNSIGVGVSVSGDISQYHGACFWIKSGSNFPMAFMLQSTNININDADYYLAPFTPVPNTWMFVKVPFTQFIQAGYSNDGATLAASLQNLSGIQFKTLSGTQGETNTFYIDNISFY